MGDSKNLLVSCETVVYVPTPFATAGSASKCTMLIARFLVLTRGKDGWWDKEAEKTRKSLERRCDELGAVSAPLGTAVANMPLTVGM